MPHHFVLVLQSIESESYFLFSSLGKNKNLLGADINIGTAQEFGSLIERQLTLWKSVVKAAGIKTEQ